MNKTALLDLLHFLENSPTAWHAVKNVEEKLERAGFIPLNEEETWKLKPGNKYFTIRNGSSLIAFEMPLEEPTSALITASHTDSPSFKLKSNPEFVKDNATLLGLEVYGSPLISSWLNRALSIAGRVFFLDKQGKRKKELIHLKDHPVILSQLAIHLDRKANEEGPLFKLQDHLAAICALDAKVPYLETLLKKTLKAKTILSFDLFLAPIEKASLIGQNQEMLSSYRIDSLLSVHACLTSLIESKSKSLHALKVIAFFNHEEVGSGSSEGISSPFLSHTLERIILCQNRGREAFFQLLAKSFLISVDLAHAAHPNYKEKHEPNHMPLLNRGIAIKQNAKLAYASNASSISRIVHLCEENKISFQHYMCRNDMPCGTTIGPLNAAATGIETVDIGVPQLAMHACQELAALKDQSDMCHLLTAFFNS
ncbi:MAG TPA: M18 family aminopeptidase [Parachlamydiaceae bacterium]|nr:M18 family aminopeptidase [Parachlamydiaceae bacterium]